MPENKLKEHAENPEERTKKLKEFNETIINSLNEGIWVEDEKGFCTYANPKEAEMLGYTQEELIGKHWSEVVYPSEYEHMKRESEKRSRGIASSYETLLITRNKEKVPVIISATPLFKEGKYIGLIGVTIDIRKQKELEKKLSAIYNLSKEMALSLSLDQISKIVLNAAEKVLNFSNIDLFLVNEEKNELHLKECRGLKEPEGYTVIPLSGEKGITAHVARTGKSLNISDVRKDERYLFGLEGSRSELCVPIKIKDKVIGVLDAESKELNAFSEEDQRLLETLASQTAIAIENARLFRELSSLKEFNESIVNSLNEGIWVEDEKGFCTYANPKIRKMLGYESLVGKHWKEIIVPEKISRMEEETKTRRYGRRSSYETVLLTNSGERIPVIVSATPLFEKGKFIGTMGVFVDIREQKKIEESLKKSERLYRSLSEFNKKLLENSPVGIMNINKEMKVEYENPEMRRILGLPFGKELDTMGMDIREIPLIKENEISSIFEELRKGKEISKELSPISVSGERIYLSLKGVSLFKGFKFVGAIVIVNDITERKRLEQQREKSRKEAEFYADVLGHDVGNINQIISGHLYLLENAKDEETRKKNVEGIKKAIMRSKRLAENIKALKTIKDRKIEKFDLNKSIERSIENIKRYSDRVIEVKLNIDKKYYVKANDLLDKVFFNIFENAIEYTFHDPVIINVRTEEKDGFCNVHIHDYGIGISKEKREDILKNLETLSKRTGMGFYLINKILDRFNGKFEIKDAKKGTEIVVSIPV